jgi:pyruvate dehydrogenase E2 component (dihydrolipoamide acetyltransferase)
MAITLSVDHRALDGATGAKFLADLTALLENPLATLA